MLTINNFDGAGARDYSTVLELAPPPKITRKLNHPSNATLALVSADPAFVPPVTGGRIKLIRADGVSLFTGYLSESPKLKYLGWTPAGKAYRYHIAAQSDEWLLDQALLP